MRTPTRVKAHEWAKLYPITGMAGWISEHFVNDPAITMHDVWLLCVNPTVMTHALKAIGFRTAGGPRNFACDCVEHAISLADFMHVTVNQYSREIIRLARRYVSGKIESTFKQVSPMDRRWNNPEVQTLVDAATTAQRNMRETNASHLACAALDCLRGDTGRTALNLARGDLSFTGLQDLVWEADHLRQWYCPVWPEKGA